MSYTDVDGQTYDTEAIPQSVMALFDETITDDEAEQKVSAVGVPLFQGFRGLDFTFYRYLRVAK